MIKVYENLFVGNESSCFWDTRAEWAVIHACKHPCHQRAVGYRGSLNRNHPNYLILERDNHLFLNMVDMDQQLSHEFTEPIISAALKFIEENIQSKKVLIHCNLGQSRSPALALLFLAKRENVLSNENYQEAKEDFIRICPQYCPGRGIEIYLLNHWSQLE